MKLIFTSIALFFIIQLQAQDIPATGSYITNNTMTAFHGTWQWVNGTDTIKIYLTTKKTFFNINGGYNKDKLVGIFISKGIILLRVLIAT